MSEKCQSGQNYLLMGLFFPLANLFFFYINFLQKYRKKKIAEMFFIPAIE